MALGGIRHMWRLTSASAGGASRFRVGYHQGLSQLTFRKFSIKYQPLLKGKRAFNLRIEHQNVNVLKQKQIHVVNAFVIVTF